MEIGANSANNNQAVNHLPYLKFDFNITQDIVQENYSKNPYIATLQKVAKVTVIGLVLVALFETIKNGAKLLANAAIFLRNLGYDAHANLSNRNIEIMFSPAIETVKITSQKPSESEIAESPSAPPAYTESVESPAPSAPQQIVERSAPPAYTESVESPASSAPEQIVERPAPPAYTESVESPAPSAPEQIVERPAPIVCFPSPIDDVYVRYEQRSNDAATTIQRAWRGHKKRKQAALKNDAVTVIQRAWRDHKARKDAAVSNDAAIVIQRAWRAHHARAETPRLVG